MPKLHSHHTHRRRLGCLGSLAAFLALSVTPLQALRITEVFYHPGPDDANESLEFIEIFNDSSIAIDLSGFYFADGVRFTFPERTFLASRTYLVVCADVDAIRARYNIDNVIGNFSANLSNRGERLTLVNQVGSVMTSVNYEDRDGWPVGPDGAGYTLALEDVFADSRQRANWVRSSQIGGTPGFENFPEPLPLFNEILPEGGTWRMKKGFDEVAGVPAEFSDPKDAWYRTDFDDGAWEEVIEPIGFNEDEIVTSLDDMRRNYYAFAVRRSFSVTQAELEAMEALVLLLRFDDGCVVYLNGEPVSLLNMRVDTVEEVTAESRARAGRELGGDPTELLIPKEKVRLGENFLAIQVHNSSLNSSDAGLAARVGYRTFRFFEPPHVAKFVINEIVSEASPALRGVEVVNRLPMALPLAGYHLSDDPLEPRKYTFPAGTEVGPRGLIAVGEADLGFSLAAEELAVFLYHPDGESLESAAAVENPADLAALAYSHVRYPDGADAWWITETPSLGAANRIAVEDGIVINEIMFNPLLLDADGRLLETTEIGEYIELYNRSDRTISLGGFALTSGFNYEFRADHVLAPGDFLVVARNVDSIQETYGLAAAQVVGLPASASAAELDDFGLLANGGESVRLRDPLGNVADEVPYADEGEWDELADGGGSSLELIDPFQDNASPHAWRASDETDRAPWTEITYTAPSGPVTPPGGVFSEMHLFLLSAGECLIDDISITSGDPPVEYITNGDFETDTSPWRLWGNHDLSFRTTDDARSGEASLHLVATGGGNNKVNRIEVTTSPRLPTNRTLTISLWARWVGGSNALHVCGHNNAYGRTVWLPLPAGSGTPGAENSVRIRLREERGSDNLGPVISKVRHAPAVPAANQPIRFEARVTDSDGVSSVELVYEVDGSGEEQRLTLERDIADDDRTRSEMYTGQLPGFAEGTIINFRVEAVDALEHLHGFPWGAPEKTYSLLVDSPLESSVFRYRMVLSRASNQRLVSQLQHSNNLVRGTFVFEEREVHYDVGFRYHGSPWNRPGSPRMYRTRFRGDHRFRGEAKRMNISRYGRDQKEGTAYQLFRKVSVPEAVVPYSPRYEYFALRLNTQAPVQSMAEIRAIDRDYAEFNWPRDAEGTAYKITGKLAFPSTGSSWDVDWTRFRLYRGRPYQGEDHAENLRFYFNPKIRRDEDSFEPILRLLRAMDRSVTPNERYEEEIESILNVESYLRTYIIRVLQDDWDTIDIGNGQNAYLYYAPNEGRIYLIPWDMDHTFANASALLWPTNSTSGTGRLYTFPKYRRLYGRLVKEFIDGPWSQDYLSEWTSLVSETTTPARVAEGGVVNFVRTRLGQVQSRLLRTATTVEFAITTPSPASVDGPAIELTGTAPLEAREFFVAVGGAEPAAAEVIWEAAGAAIPVDWKLEVAGLAPGRNNVEVFLFDREGELIASGAIEVFNTSGVAFVRGEVDGNGMINLQDAFQVLDYLFGGGELSCRDAADVDDDGRLTIGDAVHLLRYLFGDGAQPRAPFPEAGADETEDELDCAG